MFNEVPNKVKIHICKFSQQLDHISHGKLILFHFLTFSSFSFIFFKTEKAVHRGVHSVEWAKLLMAHRGGGAPLVVQLVMVHHPHRAPLVVFQKKLKQNL